MCVGGCWGWFGGGGEREISFQLINFWILQGERKITVLIGISTVFMLQVIGVYWWYRNDDLLYPLIMVPPKAVPPFWHAIFIILVNGKDLDPSFRYFLLS